MNVNTTMRGIALLVALLALIPFSPKALAVPTVNSLTVNPDPFVVGSDFTVTVDASPEVSRVIVTADFRPAALSLLRLTLNKNASDQWEAVGTVPAAVQITEDMQVTFLAFVFDDANGRARKLQRVTLTPASPDPPGELSAPTVNVSQAITAAASVTVSGSASGATQVSIEGGANTTNAPVSEDGTYSASVTLKPNMVNHLFVTGVAQDGTMSPPTPATVVQDGQVPAVFIDFPSDGSDITTDVVDVAGRVSDMLSGFAGLNVTVNGLAAEVIVGIGTNGTFERAAIPLALGANTITAVATDILGNSATTSITVNRVTIPDDAATIEVVSGNSQNGPINEVLADPVVVKVSRPDGTPFANKLVTFKVTRSNGRLTDDGTGEGSMMFQARADADGLAQAFWQVGSDAGCGNNRLECTSRDVFGSTFFCASADPGLPVQINVGSGSNQRAEAGGPAPEPLRVWVNDTCNGVEGVAVTYSVVSGGGTFPDGSTSASLTTGTTGHAEIGFILGPQQGNNVIEASFDTNPGNPVAFILYGVVRDESQPTSFSGIVLDNASQPIGGAECSLVIGSDAALMTFSDDQGQFRFDDLANAGPADLFIDGLVATSVSGHSIPPGSFPSLHFEPVVIPNAENALPVPVLLPMLNPANARTYDGTADVELTVEGAEGIKMLIQAGSMTRADGTTPSASDPAIVALNQVHFDKVPMPMPDGAAPPFAWTLQPSGATFDPPIQITYPNMSALPPGSIAYFLSFNHDVGEFQIVATGSVTDDGSEIVSDPGAGISVAGWGCNCPPYTSTADCAKCNVKVTGPESACVDEMVTYSAKVTVKDKDGNPATGMLKWTATGGSPTLVSEGPFSVNDGQTVQFTTSFQMAGLGATGPTGGGIKVEADLTCPDGQSDQHGVGVSVFDGTSVVPSSITSFGYPAIGAASSLGSDFGVTEIAILGPMEVDITPYCDVSAGLWRCKLTQADRDMNQSVSRQGSTEVTKVLVDAETNCAVLTTMRASLIDIANQGNGSGFIVLAQAQDHEDLHVMQYQSSIAPSFMPLKTAIEALTIPLADAGSTADARTKIMALAGYTSAINTLRAADIAANNATAAHSPVAPFVAVEMAAIAGRLADIDARKTTLGCP